MKDYQKPDVLARIVAGEVPLCHVDLETRSHADLPNQGIGIYARHESTEVLWLCYRFDDGPVVSVELLAGEEPPEELRLHAINGGMFAAHNAEFEYNLWNHCMVLKYDFPHTRLRQWLCTAFMARHYNLPGGLDAVGRVLRTATQKSLRGRDLIRAACIPPFYYPDSIRFEMRDYCIDDVKTECDVYRAIPMPDPMAWEDYYCAQRINQRGFRVDVEMAAAAVEYAADEVADLMAEVKRLTNGAVVKVRGEKIKSWIYERLPPEKQRMMVIHKDGEKKISLSKATRGALLDELDLDPDLREVIACSDLAQRSSVGKFASMAARANEDGRVRNLMIPYGAITNRFTAFGLQPHNFPRKTLGDRAEEFRTDLVDDIEPLYLCDHYGDNIMSLLSKSLRSAIIPDEGNTFLVSDWSSIEGRIGPWLSSHPSGNERLRAYRAGKDMYKVAAADIYNVPYDAVDDDQRAIGKVAELALGFGGGKNPFLAMAKNFGVQMDTHRAKQIVLRWRQANPWAGTLWKSLEKAAIRAFRNPGQPETQCRITYTCVTDLFGFDKTLVVVLPSGDPIFYPDVRLEAEEVFGETRLTLTCMRGTWQPKANEREWPRAKLWSGQLTENVVQATAAALLREALCEADWLGLDVVLHVHDEIICESDNPAIDERTLHEIMNTAPDWAEGLPLKADVQRMLRFGK